MILSESQKFLFGFISNSGQRIVALVLVDTGRTLPLIRGELCKSVLHASSMVFYTMVV